MTHFKQLTWRQHLAYLSCAIALAFSLAAYRTERVARNKTPDLQRSEVIVSLGLHRTMKRLRDKL